MTIIYVLIGETGSYDDYRHWNVRAYTDKVLATKDAVRAKDLSNRLLKKYRGIIDEYKYGSNEHIRLLQSNPYDPNMQISNELDPIEYRVEHLEYIS